MIDPLSEEGYNLTTLRPLFMGNLDPEQWIFPSITFTCNGTLTHWIFRGAGRHDEQGLALTTWRPDPFVATFRRVSITNRTTSRIAMYSGSVFVYELVEPVQVQPGDIVGVEVTSRTVQEDNVLSFDFRERDMVTLSYMRNFRFNLGFRPRDIYEQTYLPLLRPVIGRCIH